MKTFFASVVVCALCMASRCLGAVLGFESPDDIATYFNTVGATKFSTAANNGLSGSTSGVTNQAFTNGTIETTAGLPRGAATPTFTVSLFFRFATPTTTAGGNCLMVGIAGAVAYDPFTATSADVRLYIQKAAFSSSCLVFSSAENGGGSGSVPITFQNGGWYRLSIDAVWNTTFSRYDFLSTVNASDGSGNVGTQLVSRTNTGFTATSTTTIYGYIASGGPAADMGIAAIDNFSFPTVPEPDSAALCVFGLALLAALRQRFLISN